MHQNSKHSLFYYRKHKTSVSFTSYKNNWIRVERTREQHTLDLHMGIPWETVTLTALGRNKNLFTNLLDEGRIIFI